MFVHLRTCIVLIFLINLFNACLCYSVLYDRFSLFRITPTTKSQLQILNNIHATHSNELKFWMRTTVVNHPADIMVKPTFKTALIKQLTSCRMSYKILIDDIGKLIKEQTLTPEQKAKLGFFEAYQGMAEIDQYFQDLTCRFPEYLSLIPIGKSYEGKPLQVLRISSNPSERKPAVWLQSGFHAREPIGPAVVLYIATQLAGLCEQQNEEIYELLNSFDWYIMPVMNPDGYEYARHTDRLWRKTRSCHPNLQNCIGVDPNRNWDIRWSDTAGSSLSPCSNYYAGPKPFSEPETKAVSEFMQDHLKGRLMLFMDFHSYSQRISTPYGYTMKMPPNYYEQKRLAEVGIQAIKMVNGTKYKTGSTDSIVYTITGSARDWVFKTICPKYAYIVELRDTGKYGFLLPRCNILPTAIETWEGVKAMGLDMAERLYFDPYYSK